MVHDSALITDDQTLRGMTKAGWIRWHDGLERHWTGQTVKRRHVQPGPKLADWSQEFSYQKQTYRLHYFDGCLHPFVCRIDGKFPSFV